MPWRRSRRRTGSTDEKENPMRHVHRVVVVAFAAVAPLLCARSQAQVLNLVPEDAYVVFEVKNLGQLSTKIAKYAKDWGLQQQDARWADPLGALTDHMNIKQGLNRNGDL